MNSLLIIIDPFEYHNYPLIIGVIVNYEASSIIEKLVLGVSKLFYH